jgi:signal transduction histidine kinase
LPYCVGGDTSGNVEIKVAGKDYRCCRFVAEGIVQGLIELGAAQSIVAAVLKMQVVSHQVLISVSDTGVGLPAGTADEIFNAFFTTKPQGSGMGFAISKSIVESHGGRIWANCGGCGATFHFTLPADPAETNRPGDAA